MDKRDTTNGHANAHEDTGRAGRWPTTFQPITYSNWNLLLRNGHVDGNRTPAAQGYQIVDEVRALPSGPMERRHDPLVVGSRDEAVENIRGPIRRAIVGRTGDNSQSSAKKAQSASKAPSAVKAPARQGSSGGAWKTLWTDREMDELVRLRCQGLTYPAIAKNHLPGRDLKAIQLKFAKLQKVSPYKERWQRFKGRHGRHDRGMEEVEQEEEEEGEEEELGDTDVDVGEPDEPKPGYGSGGSGGPSGGGGAQGGAQAVQVS